MIEQHPDVHRPWSEWSEAQTLYIVIPYSNPFRWRTRRTLYNDCYRHLAASANAVPILVELAYGARPFEVTEAGHPNHVQLRTECELWHKENLINLGIQRIPPTALYAGYCDGDFHFTRQDWALEAIHMLQHYHFVQLFSSYADLTGEDSTSDRGHRPYRHNSSFAWNFTHQSEFLAKQTAKAARDPYYGLPIPTKGFPFGFPPGSPGGAWAWNMASFDAVGGMLDTCIIGSADWHMALGLASLNSARGETDLAGRAYNKSIFDWQARAANLKYTPGKAPIGCVDNFAVHHFHGSHKSRSYGDRWHMLVTHDFDPSADIHRDRQGVWMWTGNKPALRDQMRNYFVGRREDDTADVTPLV
jgi:hypothetical protein